MAGVYTTRTIKLMIMKEQRKIFQSFDETNINHICKFPYFSLTSFFNKSASQISLMSCAFAVETDETVLVTFDDDDAEDA